ncbi:23S rRNA (uracil(1939)-C(5))-methyltransferase RlmD [Vibrio agarivorans]|uniref:23S rRNA (uracil(1939)-C(5))-methyltransferase RlmD n=1 Tax=Vibrio agarivorans TaxID=153622 RepID=A0ABT7Y1Z0_9VIBR|nr:23S rRNA (uracil(1939)-C(5))-methyltransferase RlmD [Vibrio agarivorans]MDN2482043.1 23S rRNA (uracil(1939)-C(5))-methyltransferase RlmD [Vibrio agarivorans]
MARIFQAKKKTPLNTKHFEVKVDKIDHHGTGIAFHNRKPVFIDGALPDEKVLIQLVEEKSKFAKAKLIKVLKPSDKRIQPFCPHYAQCGGCNMQHLSSDDQRDYKALALSGLFKKLAKQELPLSETLSDETPDYRRRVRFSVFWDKKLKQLSFGFRKKQSKQIVDIDACPILANELNALLPSLQACLSQFQHPERLGHVELVKGDNTNIVLVRTIKALSEKDREQLAACCQSLNVTLYLHQGDEALERMFGEVGHYLEAGVTIPFEPVNFIQVNKKVNEKMVAQALDWLSLNSNDRVLDLFCGLGNFSLPIAKKVKSVIGVEGVQSMVDKATDNAQLNQVDNVAFYQANLEQDISHKAWAEQQFDKVLLDPARAGATGIVDHIAKLGAQRVVYVSCNPATLARDSQSLLAQGFTMTRLGMLDMFPHTSHLESMALFER